MGWKPVVFFLVVIFLPTFSQADSLDPSSPLGKCMTKYCWPGDKICSDMLCQPVYSGCAIPCGPLYSNYGSYCMDMCEEVGDSTDPCIVKYADEVFACLAPCIKSTQSSCVSTCKNKALENRNTCVAARNPTTITMQTTTTVVGGCNHNGQCDTSLGENCEKCGDECPCAGIECMPAKPNARADGCYDPCWNIPNTHYDISNGKCMCDNGFILDKDGSKCVSKCPANMVWENTKCACQPVWGDCDNNPENGCESNTQSDYLNCGICGFKCMQNGKCQNGECICLEGFTPINGGSQCIKPGCNNNTLCESTLLENCDNCKDCACTKDQTCLGRKPDKKTESQIEPSGCLDCNKQCKAQVGEHGLFLEFQGKECECICDIGYTLIEDKCQVGDKRAVIFISKNLSMWMYAALETKLTYINLYYQSLGYQVEIKEVSGIKDITDTLVQGDVRAMAFFAHGGVAPENESDLWKPTIEGATAEGILQNMKLSYADAYEKVGFTKERAWELGQEKEKQGSFNLDYAYVHTCHSLDDESLVKPLVKPDGKFWGYKGNLHAVYHLQEPKDVRQNNTE